jgi:hypothetical protein
MIGIRQIPAQSQFFFDDCLASDERILYKLMMDSPSRLLKS